MFHKPGLLQSKRHVIALVFAAFSCGFIAAFTGCVPTHPETSDTKLRVESPSIIEAKIIDDHNHIVDLYNPNYNADSGLRMRAIVTGLKPVPTVEVLVGRQHTPYAMRRLSDKIFELDLTTLPEFDKSKLAGLSSIPLEISATNLDGATTLSDPLNLQIDHTAH